MTNKKLNHAIVIVNVEYYKTYLVFYSDMVVWLRTFVKVINSFIKYYVEISISCSLKIVVLIGMQSGDDTIVCFIPEMK